MITVRPRNAGLNVLSSSGLRAFTSPAESGIVSGSAQSFIMVSVPALVVRTMMVFLKVICRPSPSSITPLSNT